MGWAFSIEIGAERRLADLRSAARAAAFNNTPLSAVALEYGVSVAKVVDQLPERPPSRMWSVRDPEPDSECRFCVTWTGRHDGACPARSAS